MSERMLPDEWDIAYRRGVEDCIAVLEVLFHEDPCDCDACRAIVIAQALLRSVMETERT